MAATILDICQSVLEEIGDHEVPDTLIGNPNPTARQIVALANKEGRILSSRHDWQALVTPTTLTTVSGQDSYSLPADFKSFVNMTDWDKTNHWRLFGPASPAQWQELKSGIVVNGIRRWAATMGDKFYLHPTPAVSGDIINYTYLSSYWAQSSAGVAQEHFLADTDTPRLPDLIFRLGIKWRYLKEKGLPSEIDMAEYEREVAAYRAKDGGAPRIDMRQPPISNILAVNVPEGNYG